jgi:hypothetical protein
MWEMSIARNNGLISPVKETGGVTFKGEIDFKFVLAQPRSTALSAFERLYASGDPQGKAHALTGIKKLDPQRFTEPVTALAKSND